VDEGTTRADDWILLLVQAGGGTTMKTSEMDDKKWMLYMAFVVRKLSDFKYEVYGAGMTVGTDNPIWKELVHKAPMSIDASRILMETIKRAKPDMYKKDKSIKQHEEELEKYLFGGDSADSSRT
jgi:predicted HAD superfamily Cof-like phosphohydrolase